MSKDTENQDSALVELVFSPPNVLQWDATENADEGVTAAASLSIRRFQRGKHDWPVLLPVKREDTDLCWYMCAHSETQLRALHDEMRAFVGPTFAEFPSMRGELDLDDPIEKALNEQFGGRVLKVPVPAQYEAKVSQQIGTYLSLLVDRPSITAHAVETFQQLRSRFDVALLAGNEGAAHEYLSALSARDLSAENRHFLKIRFYAALGYWDKIVAYPLLPSLLKLKLPPETYSDIFEALYQANLHGVEEAGSLDALVTAFQKRLFAPYAELFRTRRQVSRPSVLKGFVCRELSLPTPDPKHCLALLAQLPENGFPQAIESEIRARCASLQSPDPLQAAREALQMEEFDRAYALYREVPSTIESLCAMLRCAREIGDSGVAQVVLSLMSKVPPELQAEVVKRTPRMHEVVLQLADEGTRAESPAKDSSVVERLDWQKEEGESADAYVERWREGASAWDPDELLAEVGCGKKAAGIIENLSLTEPDVFEQVFPLWYRLFIERVPTPDTRLVPVYLALMDTLRVREAFAEDELTLVKRAADCVLECNVAEQLYEGMVNELDSILRTVSSFQAVDWAFEVADQLMMSACPSVEARLRFLSTAVATAQKFGRRLSPVQCSLLQQLAGEAGISVDLPSQTTETDVRGADAVTGRVAIYTLDPGAAERAKLILQRSYPQLRVDLNADTVCTTALKQLARQADWFVFAWRCATHQAWFCVKASVSNTGTLCWANGNGAASLAQAVEKQLTAVD